MLKGVKLILAYIHTGCKGEEGYIHIPKAYKQKSNNSVCSKKYQIFKGDELPKVGSIVHTIIGGLMFYKDLNEIENGYKRCDLDTKDFRRKDLFGRNEQEAYGCLMDICMTYFDKNMNYLTGDEDILHRGSEIKILFYEQINHDLFAKIKVTK
jgi:hypothetical protein